LRNQKALTFHFAQLLAMSTIMMINLKDQKIFKVQIHPLANLNRLFKQKVITNLVFILLAFYHHHYHLN